jgi:hypothetical protein
VQFDRIGPQRLRGTQCGFHRVDEQRRAYFRVPQSSDGFTYAATALRIREIQPAFRCDFLTPLRHKSRLHWLVLYGKAEHFLLDGQLQIHAGADRLEQ